MVYNTEMQTKVSIAFSSLNNLVIVKILENRLNKVDKIQNTLSLFTKM